MKVAQYWVKSGDGEFVQCGLCPHGCRIAPGASGRCRIRANRAGVLYAEGYGVISSSHVDPIEKKPLYNFCPGTDIFSIGGWGCNFSCSFCQNWSISQDFTAGKKVCAPADIVRAAMESGSGAIAYTYNEPLISMEFVLECASLASDRGLKNVAVTNGYVCEGAGRDAVDALDAFNVDIKSMDDAFYRRNCGGALAPILDFCRMIKQRGKHLEVTNLVIPGENDGEESIAALAQWVACELGRDVPVHFSAYRPEYKMENPATESGVMNRAYEVARKHLDYVYLGNVMTQHGQDSLCPQCGELLVERTGYMTKITGVRDGVCAQCGSILNGFVWQ